MSIGRITLAVGALAFLHGTLRADTLNVPGTYATVQAAIDGAAAGDTVLVAPGMCPERIDFGIKTPLQEAQDHDHAAIARLLKSKGG